MKKWMKIMAIGLTGFLMSSVLGCGTIEGIGCDLQVMSRIGQRAINSTSSEDLVQAQN